MKPNIVAGDRAVVCLNFNKVKSKIKKYNSASTNHNTLGEEVLKEVEALYT